MTTQELKEYINSKLGNSLRTLLPSYWWKRLFGLVVDRVEEVEGGIQKVEEKIIEIMSSQNSNLRNFQREIERYKQLSPNASKYLRKCLDAVVEIIGSLKPKSKIYLIKSEHE